MNNTTPTNTAIAAGAGAVVAPVVAYVASALHLVLPADVQGAVVVLIVAGAHWLSQRFPAKQPATPAQ
ncbi:hypothetical protein [Paraburkholderia tropica]|uniref:hypothetical protein n=1 Tax=Paraburkholderia tropica TaxID=92647 RepID=UPI00239FD0C9|nr:hypothetical protein [Paraburkholderia tropica]